MKENRFPALLLSVLIYFFTFLDCNLLLSADIDPRLSVIAGAMRHHRDLSNEVQLTGKMVWTKAWYKKLDGILTKDTVPSTREMDIFIVRSGDRLRYDTTEKFPGKSPNSDTAKYIMEPERFIQAFGLEVSNPTVFITEAQNSKFFFPHFQMFFKCHYSLLSLPPLTEELFQSEDVTFQVVREETYNGSKCLVLRGQMTEVGLKKSNLPLPSGAKVTSDIWVDVEKDLSIVRSKHYIENLRSIETVIELGKYGNYWFPKKINQKEYDISDGKNQLISDISFEAREVIIGQKVNPSLFTLDGLNLPPYTRVKDEINGINYRILESGGIEIIP